MGPAVTLLRLFDDSPVCEPADVADLLKARHYLGRSKRGDFAWWDDYGAMVFSNPASRMLPHDTWLELSRWCLTGGPNAGSRQWSAFVKYARRNLKHITTVVSYSDPSQGHTGALYRACNWLWAPTWHRLQPPPTGGGDWGTGEKQEPKDRWIYPLTPDPLRVGILQMSHDTLLRRHPWLAYTEPGGVDYKRWRAMELAP